MRVMVCRACGGKGWVWVTEPAGADAGEPVLFGPTPTQTREDCPDCAGTGLL